MQLGGKSYFWLEKTNVASMIQEYQVSGFRVREYEESLGERAGEKYIHDGGV